MSAETIVPQALEAHAPQKFAKKNIWLYIGIIAIVLSVAGLTLAAVFGQNASKLKKELETIMTQRSQVEERLAELVVENRDLESSLASLYYIRRSEDLKTHTVVQVDSATGEEKDIYASDLYVEILGLTWGDPRVLLLSLSGDNDTGSSRIAYVNPETGEVTMTDAYVNAAWADLSEDGRYVARAAGKSILFKNVINGEEVSVGEIAENEYFYSSVSGPEDFRVESGFDGRWLDLSCVQYAIYTDAGENPDLKTFKERRRFCLPE